MSRRRRRQQRRKRLLIGGGTIVVLLLLVAAWLAFTATQAAHQLQLARAAAQRIESDATDGTSMPADESAFQHASTAAYDDTHDPVWAAVGWLPPVHVVRGMTGALQQLGQQVLPPLARVAQTVTPSRLRVDGNTIDVAALRAAAPGLARASAAMSGVVRTVAGLPGGWIGYLDNARTQLLTQASSLSGYLSDAAGFARVGPGMLGADGPRTYFVGVQNNAESRGTGGLLSGYVILRAKQGSLHVLAHGTDADLVDPAHPISHVAGGYRRLYGSFGATGSWREANLSPNFPDVGNAWVQMLQAQTGLRAAGAFAVDPKALSRLLAVTGPVHDPVRGGTVDAAQVVPLIEQREYALFRPDQTHARKAYLSELATAVIHKLLSGAGDSTALVHALASSAGVGDLQAYSTDPRAERVLLRTPLAGAVPATDAPFASLTVDNAGGTKLDYYLSRNVTYAQTGCSGGRRQTVLTASLTNGAPATGLPPYVLLQPEIGPHAVERIARDQLLVFIDATRGAELSRLTVNGRTAPVTRGVADNRHPVFEVPVTIPPGQTATVTAYLDEPAAAGTPTTKVQPLAIPQTTQIALGACR